MNAALALTTQDQDSINDHQIHKQLLNVEFFNTFQDDGVDWYYANEVCLVLGLHCDRWGSFSHHLAGIGQDEGELVRDYRPHGDDYAPALTAFGVVRLIRASPLRPDVPRDQGDREFLEALMTEEMRKMVHMDKVFPSNLDAKHFIARSVSLILRDAHDNFNIDFAVPFYYRFGPFRTHGAFGKRN